VTERPDPTPRPGSGDIAPGLDGLTEDVLPALIARLRASRLGELEVRTADWRVRLRRDLRPTRRADPASGVAPTPDDADDPVSGPARSPAVGYFSPLAQLSVGQLIQAGDPLGSVDVLGIAQDVLAPGAGIIRAILAESGQPVEFGQPLVEIDGLVTEPREPEEAEAGHADVQPGPSESDGGSVAPVA